MTCSADPPPVRLLALSGGIGGAKLAAGLAQIMPGGELMVVANPGDDFEHLGLNICPDLDTLVYSLAGLANPQTGWGRADETWSFMDAVEELGGETWFRLGDKDLALHVERTRRLKAGETLAGITADIRQRLGVATRIVPATGAAVRTIVETPGGPLPFQHYFVREQCAPEVTGFRFEGAARARLNPDIAGALADPALAAVVICPSNPFISIDPILAIPGFGEAIAAARAPLIAVSPIVGGAAIKGPTAKMMKELGLPVSALTVAGHYAGLLDGLVIDRADEHLAPEIEALGMAVEVGDTVMRDLDDKVELARLVIDFTARLGARQPNPANLAASG